MQRKGERSFLTPTLQRKEFLQCGMCYLSEVSGSTFWTDFIKQELFSVDEDLRFPHVRFFHGRELTFPLTENPSFPLGTGQAYSNFSLSQCCKVLFLFPNYLTFLPYLSLGQVAPPLNNVASGIWISCLPSDCFSRPSFLQLFSLSFNNAHFFSSYLSRTQC